MKRRPAVVAAALLLAPSALAAPPPATHARAYMIENGLNGEVLAAASPRRRVPIASLTKLMTILLTIERTKPDRLVTVPRAATTVGGSSIHLRAGEQITVGDLLEASLIQSANDAADTLASALGNGSEARFVALMNARARQLGLTDTHYARPDGLDAAGHVSSARDVTKLARLVMRSPLVRSIVRRRSATIAGGRSLSTWNDLLGRFPGLIGVKTGHTSVAGWSEAAAAVKPGVTIYATILGDPDRSTRNVDLARLLSWGLSRYAPVRAVVRQHVYARAETGYGRKGLALVAARSFSPVVRVDRPLVERIVSTAAVRLPVGRGQRLGEIRLYQGSRLLGIRPLVAAHALDRPNLGDRVRWYARRTFDHVLGWFSS